MTGCWPKLAKGANKHGDACAPTRWHSTRFRVDKRFAERAKYLPSTVKREGMHCEKQEAQ